MVVGQKQVVYLRWIVIGVVTSMICMGCSYRSVRESRDLVGGQDIIADEATAQIVFGSCVDHSPERIFRSMFETDPDLLLLLGDSVYLGPQDFGNQRRTERRFREQYRFLPPLLHQFPTPLEAIWDDHDYGPDDSDGTFAGKSSSRAAFMSFWRIADVETFQSTLSRRLRIGELDVFLLDNRWVRQGQQRLFGEDLWDWLSDEVAGSSAALIVVATGQSFLDRDTCSSCLAQYPAEFARFKQLVQGTQVPIVVLAGDLHYGELRKREIGGRVVLEGISSPLAAGVAPAEKQTTSRFRVSQGVGAVNFGRLLMQRRGRTVIVTLFLHAQDGGVLADYSYQYSLPVRP